MFFKRGKPQLGQQECDLTILEQSKELATLTVELPPFDEPELRDHLEILFIRFYEMCRRVNRQNPSILSVSICSVLLSELIKNTQYFYSNNIKPADANKLISLTLYQGTSFAEKIKAGEFDDVLKLLPAIKKVAARSHPMTPEKYMRMALSSYNKVVAQSKFKSLRGVPSVFKSAAIVDAQYPERYLSRVLQRKQRLEQNEEFQALHAKPNIFIRAAYQYPQKSEQVLREYLQGKRGASLAIVKNRGLS